LKVVLNTTKPTPNLCVSDCCLTANEENYLAIGYHGENKLHSVR
jgi:hypothetical protein